MAGRKEYNQGFYAGVMSALAVVYEADQETTAEEIVRAVGAAPLLKTARANDDPWLSNLRGTVKFLREMKAP